MIVASQRVVMDSQTGERRDALDQRWPKFLQEAGLPAIAVPNAADILPALLDEIRPRAVLLTGGNDLSSLGGTAPERDDAEARLMAYAREKDLPLLGVCRGMQVIQQAFGVRLHPVESHVCATQTIAFEGNRVEVNSYHNFGSRETAPGLEVCGLADDGVVKAVRSSCGRMFGIMWHPERINPARTQDVQLFRNFLGGQA